VYLQVLRGQRERRKGGSPRGPAMGEPGVCLKVWGIEIKKTEEAFMIILFTKKTDVRQKYHSFVNGSVCFYHNS
jgi:hypothetical protein